MIGDIITATISGVVVLGILLTSITAILIIIGMVVIGVMTMDGDVLAQAGNIELVEISGFDLPAPPGLPIFSRLYRNVIAEKFPKFLKSGLFLL